MTIAKIVLDQQLKVHAMIRDVLPRFTPEQWVAGESWWHVPARLAFHTGSCVPGYYKERAENLPPRFDKPWWEMELAELPDPACLLARLDEIDARVTEVLEDASDADMLAEDEAVYHFGPVRLEHYVYAMRHTNHHAAQLILLAVQNGEEKLKWA